MTILPGQSYDSKKPRSQARNGLSARFSESGADGSRTRVQKPIPCSSTIIVRHLTFPLSCGEGHPQKFSSSLYARRCGTFPSSFLTKSMPDSQRVSALRPTQAAIKQQEQILCYLRLILSLPFNALHTDSFTSCTVPVETGTAPR